jgi:tetraprenyl-beta-curcumene synthase
MARTPVDVATPTARARLFADAARRYWLQVFPAARATQRRLYRLAAAIPDPLLRADALVSHRQKRSNSEGLAALAVLAPAAKRASVARSLVSYQLMLDYLDGVSERLTADPISNGLRLHRAFEVALDPDADHGDYYALAVANEDGGYLKALIDTCREPLRDLPSYPAARPALLRQARLCRDSQTLNHALHVDLGDRIAEWAQATASDFGLGTQLEWWELLAAAAASSLSVGALLVLAADPAAGEADAREVEHAYFPWASGLNALLDSLVDLEEDPEHASHLRRYRSNAIAVDRLALFASTARDRVSVLSKGSTHEMILAAMATLYLVRPEAWRPECETVSDGVLAAVGPFGRPTLLVHLARRGGRGGGSLIAARRRAHRRGGRSIMTSDPMSDTFAKEAHELREALLDLCAERGYANLRLPELLRTAGLDQSGFERHYANLDACFGGVLAEVYEEFFASAQEAVAAEHGWRDRMRATAYALLRFLRRDTRVARLAAVEAQQGGEAAERLFLDTFNRLVDLIDEGSGEASGPDSPSRATALGVGGVLFARVQEAVAKDELGLGEEEIPELMYAAVFPYLGAEAAAEELRIPPPPDLAG